MIYKLNSTIDLDVLVSETLEIILSESNPVYYVDRNQSWFNAVVKMDASLIENPLQETIQSPLWFRIVRCMFNSFGLSIPFYADNQFETRIGDINIEKFITGCNITSHEFPEVWNRLLWGDATAADYFIYFNNSINN